MHAAQLTPTSPCICSHPHARAQPVVVALSAYANSFQYYSGGIMDDFAGCCNTDDCQVGVYKYLVYTVSPH